MVVTDKELYPSTYWILRCLFFCVFYQGVLSRNVQRDPAASEVVSSELWLEDFSPEFDSKDYLYEMQSDSTGYDVNADDFLRCPPPPKEVPTFGCNVHKCSSDKECLSPRQKCCFNGCAYTCLATMNPPPVVDWRKEPPRRLQSGTSWLVPAPDEEDEPGKVQAEPCSTSEGPDENEEDALFCPQGYICHVEDPGDPTHGLPNRGRCVKEYSNFRESPSRPLQARMKPKPKVENGCRFHHKVHAEGATFWYHGHLCSCEKGSISCRVGRRKDWGS